MSMGVRKKFTATLTAALCSLALTLPAPAEASSLRESASQGPAAVESWDATFAPDALATYVGEGAPKVIVVPADAKAEAAAGALRGALAGSTSLVMDSAAIGDASGLDDAKIVERAQAMPVDQVVVVRVFDAGEGAPQNVVVTFYAKSGAVATALTGAAGTPIAANAGGSAGALDGVSEGAAEAVSEVSDELDEQGESEAARAKADRRDRLRRYKSKYLWAEDWIGVNAETGQVISSWTVIRQGESGAQLKGADFYRALGRDDLVQEYRKRRGIRYGVGLPLILGGIALTIGGTAALVSSSDTAPDFGDDDPIGLGSIEPTPRIPYSTALGITIGGTGVAFVGAFFMMFYKSHPVKREEAGRLIEKHNRDLRDTLGLEELARRVQVAPLVGPVQGVSVGGKF